MLASFLRSRSSRAELATASAAACRRPASASTCGSASASTCGSSSKSVLDSETKSGSFSDRKARWRWAGWAGGAEGVEPKRTLPPAMGPKGDTAGRAAGGKMVPGETLPMLPMFMPIRRAYTGFESMEARFDHASASPIAVGANGMASGGGGTAAAAAGMPPEANGAAAGMPPKGTGLGRVGPAHVAFATRPRYSALSSFVGPRSGGGPVPSSPVRPHSSGHPCALPKEQIIFSCSGGQGTLRGQV